MDSLDLLPDMATRVGSTPYWAAFCKRWTVAVSQSVKGAGNGCSGARRYLQPVGNGSYSITECKQL